MMLLGWRLFGGGWCQVTEGLGLAEALWPQGLAQSSRHSSGVGVGSVRQNPRSPSGSGGPGPACQPWSPGPSSVPGRGRKGSASSPNHAAAPPAWKEGQGQDVGFWSLRVHRSFGSAPVRRPELLWGRLQRPASTFLHASLTERGCC